jgi:hypothetical protein
MPRESRSVFASRQLSEPAIQVGRVEEVRMSSLHSTIVSAGPPEICEVSAGIYAYIQPDESTLTVSKREWRQTQ